MQSGSAISGIASAEAFSELGSPGPRDGLEQPLWRQLHRQCPGSGRWHLAPHYKQAEIVRCISRMRFCNQSSRASDWTFQVARTNPICAAGFVALEALGTLERLAEMGSWASGLEAAFARALHHRDKEVREKAGATLYRSANSFGHEEAAAQAIAELLAYIDPAVKEEACLLLKRVGPTSVTVSAVSSRISQGYDEPTRCAALVTLAELAQAGEEHPPGTPKEGNEREEREKEKENKESTSEIRKVQERNQWAIKAAQAIARLGLRDPAAVVRQEAIHVMEDFAPEAWPQALQTVQHMLESLRSKQASDFQPEPPCKPIRSCRTTCMHKEWWLCQLGRS